MIMKKIIVLLMIVLLSSCSSKEAVVMHEFVGHNVEEVYDWCATLSDDYSCEISYDNNEEYEKDIVFEQSVKAGKKIKDVVHFSVSNGPSDEEITMPYITAGVTKSDIEAWAQAVGLKNITYQMETNETIEKNHVIRLEPSVHVKKDTPVVAYISSGPSEPVHTSFDVNYGDYIGLTVEEFEKKAKELGLNPNHQESRDRYNPDVKLGNISWHGSGTYETGEVFNYGICINAIVINPGEYVGKSEEEFIKIAKKTNLKPVHISTRDAYSSTIDMGYIVTHGNGVYEENEDFKYGLSMGPAIVQQGYEGISEEAFIEYLSKLTLRGDRQTKYSDSVKAGRIITYNYGRYSSNDAVTYYVSLGPEETYIDVPDFTGRPEEELLNFYANNGILIGGRVENESLLPAGTITYNDHGKMKAGQSAVYNVSTGPVVQETAIIEALSTIQAEVSFEGDYEHAEFVMHRYLFGRGFTNYEIVPVVYADTKPGILLSITIDGEELQDYPVNVPLNAYIECKISKGFE